MASRDGTTSGRHRGCPSDTREAPRSWLPGTLQHRGGSEAVISGGSMVRLDIVEAQEKYGWGKSIVEHLAKDLIRAFPNSTYGFSARNLWDMRRFYLEYRDHPNLRHVVAEIPWGQNLVILNKVKDIKTREYYLLTTRQMG